MAEASAGELFVREGEKLFIELWIVAEFSFLKLLEVGGVLFVSEIVARDVIGLERDGLLQALRPTRLCLMGDGEHEVEVAGRDPSLS